jgi:hypothetical protein
MAKSTAITGPYTKTQTLSEIATNTGLTKKDVSNVVEELSSITSRSAPVASSRWRILARWPRDGV